MSDIIQLLPDSVANQIAAGEVIQRPASVVKELVENAVDAGATEIDVIIKDAGRTLIQVVDNGFGMSESDARLAFERHATSKIRQATDLFAIRSMGFRGEALASIAAVAQVELKSKKADAELGIYIEIAASKVEKQEPINCPVGSNFSIKNLFFNIPARRKFLKSNATELRHIITEIQRVALANPEVKIVLIHNDQPLMNLVSTNMKQRIIAVNGKAIGSQLIPVEVDTTIASIRGFIGKPEGARRTMGEQYFFVNNRFMRHPYLHKAVTSAYENIISHDLYPSYFIFFDINPELIDVNIHPTKTEIKFEDEQAIWKILNAAVREALGKYNVVPSIDFDTEGQVDIPTSFNMDSAKMPSVNFNPSYNPFSETSTSHRRENQPQNWDKLYEGFEKRESDFNQQSPIVLSSKSNDFETDKQIEGLHNNEIGTNFFQIKNRYILTPVKSGLMIIEQRRAHERILYERFLRQIKNEKITSQRLLFIEKIDLNSEDSILLKEIMPNLKAFGFDIVEKDDSFEVSAMPSIIDQADITNVIDSLLDAYKTGELDVEEEMREQMAAVMARNACMNVGEVLSNTDMTELASSLLACNSPNYTPDGRVIMSIIDNEELEKRFK